MTDQDRFEHIESVRDLYRDEGAQREREHLIKTLKGFPIEVYRNGMLEEQQRIIKLIEENNKQYPQPSEESEALWEIIALIKGETNEHQG